MWRYDIFTCKDTGSTIQWKAARDILLDQSDPMSYNSYLIIRVRWWFIDFSLFAGLSFSANKASFFESKTRQKLSRRLILILDYKLVFMK